MKARQNNVELLRIISMLMIIALHFIGHGKVLGTHTQVSANLIFCEIIKGISIVAVNCYILISGYFCVNNHIKASKIVSLLTQIWTYSAGIFFALLLSKQIHPDFQEWIHAMFPVATNMDGFSTVYLMMYILSPFANRLIRNLNQREFRLLLIILVAFFALRNSVFLFLNPVLEFGGGYGIVWFMVLYFTGAYIRKYPHDHISAKKRGVLYLVTGSALPLTCILAIVAFRITGSLRIFSFKELFYYYNSIFTYAASIALFGWTLKWNVKRTYTNKLISFFSLGGFGVYLIHDNPFLREFLWRTLNPSAWANSPWLVGYLAVCTVGIFSVCALIERLRQAVFSKIKPYQILLQKADNLKWENKESTSPPQCTVINK